MSRIKDLWMDKHEALCEEYLEAHPDATDEEAHEHADKVLTGTDAFADHMAELTDRAYQQEKDRRQCGQ